MTLSRSSPRAKQRWTLLGAVILVVTLLGAVATQAALDRTLFELDKDAHNNTLSTKIAVLNAAVSALPSADSIQVCQTNTTAYTGTILVDAERMTLGAMTNASGGGCPTGFTNKRNYGVTRAVDDTTIGAHAKAEDVTLLDFTAQDGDDWDDVYANILANPDSKCDSDTGDETDLGAVECIWIHDDRAASIFTSSKDYDEIEDWQWRDQSVPDADELDDGFAVKYIDTEGDQHVYFGADRFAVNGSKDAGFWFFHEAVGTVDPVGSADGTFDGFHTAPNPGDNGVFCGITGQTTPNCAPYDADDTGGDVLILTTFTGGGAVTTVRVFEWIGPAGSDAALLQRGTAADCVPGDGTQSLCATVNNTTIESPWPYSGKSEPALDEIASGGFLEGGVNLTDLGLEGCFSSFMATTRSSPSLTADPKDFILGNFEACATELTTTPQDGAEVPSALTDADENDIPDIQIGTGAAGVDVSDAALLDVKGTPTFTGSLDFYLCGPITAPIPDDPATTEVDESVPGDTCDTGGVQIGAAADTNPVTANGTYYSATANLTEAGYYCWRGEFASGTDGVPDATDASDGECFEVLPVQPTLTTQAVACEEELVEEEIVVTCTALEDSVPFGDPIYDQASLSGTAHQPGTDGGTIPDDPASEYPSINATMDTAANGSITFKLYGPLPTDTEAEGYEEAFEAACDTLAAEFPAAGISVTVDGDGDYNTFESPFEPQAPGLYAWKATYSGDDPNTLGATHNEDCAESAELVTIQQLQPTMDTAQSFVPNDSATVTVEAGAGDLDGYLVFMLWVDDDTCAPDDPEVEGDGPVYTSAQIPVFDEDDGIKTSLTATESSLNSISFDADHTFYWVVEFHSDTSSHLDVTSGCGNETSSITIDNGDTQPATP